MGILPLLFSIAATMASSSPLTDTTYAAVVTDFSPYPSTSAVVVSVTAPAWAAAHILTALDEEASYEARAAAVNRLALTRSETFLPVFSVLLEVGGAQLQRRSVEALGLITAPTATKKLRQVASLWPSAVAERAFTALGIQGTRLAAETLHALAANPSTAEWRRHYAIESLNLFYPAYMASNPVARPISSAGLAAYALAGAELGAATLLAVGSYGVRPELSMSLGALSGAAVGLGAGYIIGEDKQWSTVRGYRALSYQTWGLASGLVLSVPLVDNIKGLSGTQVLRIATGMGALGTIAGSYLAHIDDAEFPLEKQVLSDVSGIAGGLFAGGVMSWTPEFNNSTAPALILTTSSLAGLIGARYLAPHLEYDSKDAPLLFTTTFAGAWYPAWMNVALGKDDNPERVAGWILAGGSTGWFTGLALSHYLEDTAKPVLVGDVFGLFGGFLGAGVMQAAGYRPARHSDGLAASHIAGSVAGFATGAILANSLDPKPEGQLLIAGTTAFGAFQGFGFSEVADRDTHEVRGWAFIGGVSGAAAGLAIAQAYEIEYPVVGAVLSGSGLGAWSSVLAADLADLEDDDYLLATLVGTDAGLLASVGLIGLGMEPVRIGWGGVFGLGGSGLAAAVMAMASPSKKDIEGAALGGTVIGALVGGAVATKLTPPSPNLEVETSLRFRSLNPILVRMDGTAARRGVTATFEF